MRHSRTPIAVALVLWAFCSIAVATSAEIRRALLIGNDAYGGSHRLYSCVNDAKAMSKWLQTVGYEKERVTLLTDATRPQIIEALEKLVSEVKARPHHQALFYYSGHGMQLPDNGKDESDSIEEAIVAIPPGTIRNIEEIVVRDDKLMEYMNQLCDTGTQVIVMLDCCYAGGNAKSIDTKAKPKKMDLADLEENLLQSGADDGGLFAKYRKIRGKSLDAAPVKKGGLTTLMRGSFVFLAASNQYEPSLSGDPLSAFTSCFLDAVGPGRQSLSGGRGVLTLQELQGGMERALAGIPQQPMILASELGGDSPFIPGVFPIGADTAMAEELASILHGLITLDPRMRASDWSINATASVPSPIRVGTKFCIKCRPNQSGYLVAFTVGRSGRVSVLFPNRYRRQNQVLQNEDVLIPYPEGLQMQPPGGREAYYIVLLEEDPFARFDFGKYGKDLIAGDASELAARFRINGQPMSSETLLELLSVMGGNRSRDMAIELADTARDVASSVDQRERSALPGASESAQNSDPASDRAGRRWYAEQLVLDSTEQ